MKMRFLLIFAALALTACTKEPVAQSKTDNNDITVSELFTHNGVTVYRFVDAGEFVYFTTPAGPGYQTSHSISCGKNCTRQQIVTSSNKANE